MPKFIKVHNNQGCLYFLNVDKIVTILNTTISSYNSIIYFTDSTGEEAYGYHENDAKTLAGKLGILF